MHWEPIFTEKEEKNDVLNLLDTITNQLPTKTAFSNVGLMGGIAGISIYWEYLFKLKNNINYKETSRFLLNSALTAISNVPLNYWFSTGISGILWTYTHLFEQEIQATQSNKIVSAEIDSFLIQCSKIEIERGNLDYLCGGIGPIIYFMNTKDRDIRKKLEGIINILDAELKKSQGTIPWMDWMEFEGTGNKRHNLGLAHGIPSILIILARLLQEGICVNEIRNLLQNSISWLLNNRNEPKENTSLFPAYISDSAIEKNNRLAWCYGDIGIAIVLLQCAEITKNAEWKNEAIKIALHSSKRKETSSTGVEELPFCHGSIGIAHIFNRFYQYTRNEEFKEVSRYWFLLSIENFKHNGHLMTIKLDESGTKRQWEQHAGILDGYSGIGLALISTISDIEPKWDRCLLLS